MPRVRAFSTSHQQLSSVTSCDSEQTHLSTSTTSSKPASSTSSKRSWFSKLTAFVRPRRLSRSPSPTSAPGPHTPQDTTRVVVTAKWVNATAGPSAPWRSEVTLHPATVNPPALHPMPAGPTALSPSPYMVGQARPTALPPRVRPRAYTTISVPVSPIAVAHPYGSPFPSPIPSPSPTTPVAWGSMYPPQQMIHPIPVPTYIPSLPPPRRSTRAAPPRLHNMSAAAVQANLQHFPQTSPPTVLNFNAPAMEREMNRKMGHVHARSMDSGASPALTVSDVLSDWSMSEPPSAWATPASSASRRLSGATCISSHTFGH